MTLSTHAATDNYSAAHYPLDVILLCVRWYVAYSLSLRNLEEMMAERGIEVDHSSVHRCVIKLVPLVEKAFGQHKRPVGNSWRMDEPDKCKTTVSPNGLPSNSIRSLIYAFLVISAITRRASFIATEPDFVTVPGISDN